MPLLKYISEIKIIWMEKRRWSFEPVLPINNGLSLRLNVDFTSFILSISVASPEWHSTERDERAC